MGWGGGSIPGPWTTHAHTHTQDVGRPNPATESFKRRTDAGINFRIRHLILGFTKLEFLNVALMVKTFFFSRSPSGADSLTVSVQHSPPPPPPPPQCATTNASTSVRWLKIQTLAAMPLSGHTKILYTLVGMGSAALAAAVLPG